MPRDYQYELLSEIKTRYAVRFFAPQKLSRQDLLPLVDAARFAPSCFNEQPWRFLLGDNPRDFDKLADALNPGNAWAKEAGALVLVLGVKAFKYDGSKNAFCRFDSGAAAGFFQLEAVRRGLAVHCMAGFDRDRLRESFQIPDTLDIMDLMAVGYPADPATLTEEQKKLEQPGTRNPLESFLFNP